MSDDVRKAIENYPGSKYELAKRTGVSQSCISLFLGGKRDMTLRVLEKMAKEIGVKITTERKRGRKR